MERLNYTVITVSSKEVKRVMNNVYFDTRSDAERYAEGLTVGAAMAGKRWSVMMLLNGKFDARTVISKNMDSLKVQVYLRDCVWPKESN